jgi:lauroyl/myristoyl acyltransferase
MAEKRDADSKRSKKRSDSERLERYASIAFKISPSKEGLAKALHWIYSSNTIQKSFFGNVLKLVEETLPWVIPEDRPTIAGELIFTKAIRIWQQDTVATCRTENLKRWVSIAGADKLDRARDDGRGVILANSHLGAGRILPLILGRLGYEIHSYESDLDQLIRPRDPSDMPATVHIVPSHVDFDLKSLYIMHNLMKQAKILHLAADGFRGSSRVEVPFNGRSRAFRATFADLAVRTGASVLPVFALSDRMGRIHVQIHERLDLGSENQPNAERVKHVVRQYARILEDAWHSHPGNLMLKHLARYERLTRPKPINTGMSAGDGP